MARTDDDSNSQTLEAILDRLVPYRRSVKTLRRMTPTALLALVDEADDAELLGRLAAIPVRRRDFR